MKLAKLAYDAMYNSEYVWDSQEGFLNKLSAVDIKITAETLRNWERKGLITPPRRSGQSKGRRVEYSDYALAETFAVYNLTGAQLSFQISELNLSVPKFTLAQLAVARNVLLKHNYYVPHFPKPPKASGSTGYFDFTAVGLFDAYDKFPPIEFSINSDGTIIKNTPEIVKVDLSDYVLNQIIQSTYISWFYALSLGCKKLLKEYRK